MEMIDAVLRGSGITVAAIVGLLFARLGLRSPLSIFGGLHGLGMASYLVCTSSWMDQHTPIWWLATTLCHFIPLWFWLFARAMFADISRLGHAETGFALAYVGFVAVYIWSIAAPDSLLTNVIGQLFRLIGLALGLYVLFDVAREYHNDLVEDRRKLRLYLVAATGVFYVALVTINVVTQGLRPTGSLMLVFPVAIILLNLGLIFYLTRMRTEVLPELPVGPRGNDRGHENVAAEGDGLSNGAGQASHGRDASRLDVGAVLNEMMENRAYRDETLTIVSLASRLGTQEYLLRRTINQGLGQRNFNSFLNKYRLAEVEEGLLDPAQENVPILTLALSAGFNSIGPFNRAFKAKHGLTPREFRAKHKQGE